MLTKVLRTLLMLLLSGVAFAADVLNEPPTAPILRIDPGEHTATIRRIATDAAGRYLVTASDDKTARVWDLKDGRLLTTLRIPIGSRREGMLNAVALSPDGQTVALGGWTQFNSGARSVSSEGITIFLVDRASGRLMRRLSGLPNAILHLAFSPDGRSLAAALLGKGGLRLFAVADGRLLAEDRDYDTDSYSVHFSPQDPARIVTTSWDGLLRLYRFDGNKLILLSKRAAPGGGQPYAARFSPDGQLIAVGFHDTSAVNVLAADDLSLRYAPDTAGVNANLGYGIAWSADSNTLFAAGLAQKIFNNTWSRYIRRWAGRGAGAAQDWPVAGNTLMSLAPLPNGRLAFGSFEPSWGVVDADGMRHLFHAPVGADFRDNHDGFALSADGAQVRFGYELFGKTPAVFDSQSRHFLAADTPNLLPPALTAPGLMVTDWKYTTAPKLNGTVLTLKPYEQSRSLALLPGSEGFILGADWYLHAFDRTGSPRWQYPAPGAVWAVNASQDGRWVVAAYADGTIRWHRAADGAEQLAFFPHADKKRWVMWTPNGYYDASPGAEELIGWHLNRGKDQAADFFPASRFRAQFYRPDVLARVLETRDEAEAVRLANAEAGRKTQMTSVAQVLPPVVEILSPNEGTNVSSPTLTLKFNTRSPNDAPVTALRVRINGQAVPLPETRNLAVGAVGMAGVREITLPMPPQDSEIQLFAENRNGVSTPAVLRVTWSGTQSAAKEENLFKPKLYILAVGVSKYANPDYNLALAAKDAADLAAVFQKQKGKLYGDVVVRLLTDAKATRDDVVDGLDWLKREVTAKDVGVMFLAGHGMNDNTGKYYFMPHNADPAKLLRTGVAQSDIRDTLNSLAGKAVFFVDTCHSGNALGTAKTRAMTSTTDAFVNELASAENGVVVFTAATGRQLSQEKDEWGNGAFTKAVVEGLNGKADAQKTGRITHKALDYYVSERVKQLTKGEQSPVSIAPQGVTDFPIAVTR